MVTCPVCEGSGNRCFTCQSTGMVTIQFDTEYWMNKADAAGFEDWPDDAYVEPSDFEDYFQQTRRYLHEWGYPV